MRPLSPRRVVLTEVGNWNLVRGMSTEAADKPELKRRIRALKSDVQTALEAKDGVKAKRLRRKVKLLKRATRRLTKTPKPAAAPAEAAPAAEAPAEAKAES